MSKKIIELLRALFFNKVYSSQTLNFLFASQSYASRCKNEALDKDLIRKTEYRKRERTEHTITLFYLTKRGLKYLFQNDKALSEWADRETGKHLSPLKDADRRDPIRFRISRDTMCLTIAQMAGAYIPINNYTTIQQAEKDLDTEKGTIPAEKFLASHLTDELYQELFDQSNSSHSIVFYNSRCIKAFASGNTHKYADITSQDFATGRYSGAIISPYKNVLMYGAPMFGMSWSNWITRKEASVFRRWSIANSIATPEQQSNSGLCGVLVVYNEIQFKNIYLNVDKVNQAGAAFGGPFDHLYIIPLSEDGAKHLRWVMNTDERAMNKEIIEDAIDSGMYQKSTKAAPHIFPIENEKRERTALGFYLDGKSINEIREIAMRLPNEQFSVLCYAWQEPYYMAVLPKNVGIEIIDMG